MARHLKRLPSGNWAYYRRVPKRVRGLDHRRFACISLETPDRGLAEKRLPGIAAATEAYWEALIKGKSADAVERYDAAVTMAKIEGFAYRPAADLAAGPLDQLLARVERLEGRQSQAPVAEALLGLADRPALVLSRAIEIYFEHTAIDRRDQSPDQGRRWEAPRRKAVANFIALRGDKDIALIDREDALAFRKWWGQRIEAEGLTPNSANKDFGHLSQIIEVVADAHRIETKKPFAGLRYHDPADGRRPAFTSDWIRDKLIPGLDGLEDDERCAILGLVETGLRPVELLWLDREHIDLTHNIPHVRVRGGQGRRLKTKYSSRDVPLVGCALEAFRAFPEGFARYRDKSSQFSDRVNHYCAKRGLLPTDRHSIYCLRHSFKDRLDAAEIPDRIQDELMGHKTDGPVYGDGPSLEHKQQVLLRTGVTTQLPGLGP